MQNADAPLETIISGPKRVELAVVVGDRRARIELIPEQNDDAQFWKHDIERMRDSLLTQIAVV